MESSCLKTCLFSLFSSFILSPSISCPYYDWLNRPFMPILRLVESPFHAPTTIGWIALSCPYYDWLNSPFMPLLRLVESPFHAPTTIGWIALSCPYYDWLNRPFTPLLRLVESSGCLANGFNTQIFIDEIFACRVRRIVTSGRVIFR